MTQARALVISVLGLMLLAAGLLSRRPLSDRLAQERLMRLEENGAKVAIIARARRLEAERSVVAFRASAESVLQAKHVSDARIARLARVADSLRLPSSLPGDTGVWKGGVRIVGPLLPPLDSVITVGAFRQAMSELVDTANAAILVLLQERAAAQMQLGRAAEAIGELEAALQAQDSVITNNAEVVALLRQQRPGWLRRAKGGVLAAVAGGACGGLGFIFGGPLGAGGGAVLCAAGAGIATR